MAKVPEAVERQAKEAEKLQQELTGKEQKGKKEAKPDKKEPPKKPEQTAPPGEQQPPVDWEQKYKVLKGKYDAEVNADISALQERLTALEAQNADLQQKLMEATNTIATLNQLIANGATGQTLGDQQQPGQGAEGGQGQQPEASIQPLKEEDFEPYGEELVQLARNFNALVNENQKLRDVVSTMYQDRQHTAEERFWNGLKEAVPDWEKLNNDPGFLRWLNDIDMASGQTRKELLDRHFYNLNPAGVAYFFNAYKQEAGLATSSQQQRPQQPAQEQPVVMPDTGGAAPPPPEQGNITVTREQMAKAAEDYSKGKITEEEFQKISDAFQRNIQQVFNVGT